MILDRRIPPWGCFSETLPLIEASGWRGPVLLITAAPEGVSASSDILRLIGPVSKSDLLEPEAVARATGEALAAGAELTDHLNRKRAAVASRPFA